MKYFKKLSSACYYEIDDEKKIIFKHSLKETKKLIDDQYDRYIDQILVLPEIRKGVWRNEVNKMYNLHSFEWFFEGKKFKTCDFNQEYVFNQYEKNKEVLAFHQGYVWEVLYYGPYLPQVALKRKDNGRRKWSNIKNLSGIRQC
jgi:hypothetical protein